MSWYKCGDCGADLSNHPTSASADKCVSALPSSNQAGLVREALEIHDLRRWARFLKADGSLDYLRCPCGFKTESDTNEAMFGHVAEVLIRRAILIPEEKESHG
jgi:DNA-directed RNA polymerase subunit RPC12/RpoP